MLDCVSCSLRYIIKFKMKPRNKTTIFHIIDLLDIATHGISLNIICKQFEVDKR